MLLELTYRYQPPQPQNIYFFILCNVGELGDLFVLAPRGIDLGRLQEKLMSNEACHADHLGHQYCRISRISAAKLCWTFNYISTVGRSVGRKGVMYTFGCVFEAGLLLVYDGVLFNLFYSLTHEVHATQVRSGHVEEAIDEFVSALIFATAISSRLKILNYVHAVQVPLLLFEAGLRAPNSWQRATARLRAAIATILRHKPDAALPVAAVGALTTEDVMWIFNSHMSRIAPTYFLAKSAVTTWQEFASDTSIEIIQVPETDGHYISTHCGVLPNGRFFLTIQNGQRARIARCLRQALRAIRKHIRFSRNHSELLQHGPEDQR